MKKGLATGLVLLATMAWSVPAQAQVYVAPAPVEVASEGGGLTWYGGVAAILSFHGWTADSVSDQTWDMGFAGGVYASSYYVLGDWLHAGGYIDILVGRQDLTVAGVPGAVDHNQFGIGFSVKLGLPVGSMAWIGGAVDLGLHIDFDDKGDTKNVYGVEVFPRFDVELIFLDTGSFILSGTLAVGPRFVPYATTGESDSAWLADISSLIGINFGY
jgi:hypothetical protein